jgi:hypothetical protein
MTGLLMSADEFWPELIDQGQKLLAEKHSLEMIHWAYLAYLYDHGDLPYYGTLLIYHHPPES